MQTWHSVPCENDKALSAASKLGPLAVYPWMQCLKRKSSRKRPFVLKEKQKRNPENLIYQLQITQLVGAE